MPNLIGSDPSQISTNGMLGTLAFQDSASVQITGGKIGGVDVSAIASAVLTGEETDTINSSANLVLRGGGVNLFTYSDQFDNAAWTKTSATVTANATTAPDGTTTADKLVEAAATAFRAIEESAALTAQAYTQAWYVKAAERNIVQLLWSGGASTNFANFDLSAGTVTAGTYTTATITPVGNGWYRITLTSTCAAGSYSAILSPQTSPSAARAASYTGDGTSGLFLWGVQLVPGTSPGPYTKTTAQAIVSAAPALIDAPNGMAEALPSSVTPPRNGDMVIEATSNTTLTFKLRGTDGTVRSGTLTLA